MPKTWRKDVNECSLSANRIGTGIMIVASIAVALMLPEGHHRLGPPPCSWGYARPPSCPCSPMASSARGPHALAAKLSLVVGAAVGSSGPVRAHRGCQGPLGCASGSSGSHAVAGCPGRSSTRWSSPCPWRSWPWSSDGISTRQAGQAAHRWHQREIPSFSFSLNSDDRLRPMRDGIKNDVHG